MRALLLALASLAALPLSAQSFLDRSPGIAGTWTVERGEGAFVFAHRFELMDGGDEVLNVPTLTLALGLPLGLTAGLDYTSNSEIVGTNLGGNETQYWLKRAVDFGGRAAVSGLVAYNTAARSVDGAVSARGGVGPLTLLGELRGLGRRLGEDEPGVAGSVGAVLRATPYLGLAGDVARPFWGSQAAVWSAGLGIAIPGSPHTLSLHATNGGALTLQAASLRKQVGSEDLRYGFVFTAPLGSGSRWARIFRPGDPPLPPGPAATIPGGVAVEADSAAVTVEMRQVAYGPKTVRIRAGQSVAWVNRDPLQHTVTADDGGWDSGVMDEGARYVRRFDTPGRYRYHCTPHPQMKGVVVVER
jgi:plastocyanin